jgi:hypothetical protein
LVWTPGHPAQPHQRCASSPAKQHFNHCNPSFSPSRILPLSHCPIVDCAYTNGARAVTTLEAITASLRNCVSQIHKFARTALLLLSTRQQLYPPEPPPHHSIVFKMKGTWLESKKVSWIGQDVPIFVNANVSH